MANEGRKERYKKGTTKGALESRVQKTAFQGNSSRGVWELEVPNVGGISIIDETGSSRDPMRGGRIYTGGKYYEYSVYDNDGRTVVKGSAENLNDAKRKSKEELKRKIK